MNTINEMTELCDSTNRATRANDTKWREERDREDVETLMYVLLNGTYGMDYDGDFLASVADCWSILGKTLEINRYTGETN